MLRRLASVSRLERNAPTDDASDLQGARERFFEDGRRMYRASAARDLADGCYARTRARRRGLGPYGAQVRATIFYARSWKDVTLGFCRARLKYHARLCRGFDSRQAYRGRGVLNGDDDHTMNTSTNGLHSAWGGAATDRRFSSSIRGRKASMRGGSADWLLAVPPAAS